MKKKNVINLVKYYAEKNDAGFRTEAYEIARDLDRKSTRLNSSHVKRSRMPSSA